MKKRFIAFILIFCIGTAALMGGGTGCAAADGIISADILDGAAAYLLRNVENPTVSSVGGEWTVIAIARSGRLPREYAEKYLVNLEKYLTECGGALSERKYTEYSRVILALTALGKNPQDAAGYDLTLPLGDFEGTVRQGINGAIWALAALDSGKYQIPKNSGAAVQASREMYIDYILGRQMPCGGFSLNSASENADPDITGMALAALAGYTDSENVAASVNKAVEYLSLAQNENGGYESWGTENPESAAQVLIGITSVGISPRDSRFIKNGRTLIDNILSFARSDGGFEHERGGGAGVMPTEQALCGLAAALRFENGESGIFDMSAADKTEQNRINAAELLWYICMRRYTKGNVFLYNYVCGGSGQR